MILVNINRSGAKAVTPEQIKDVSRGAWVLSETSEKEYADVLVAVRKNVVVGAWDIVKTKREQDGRATFTLAKKPSSFESLICQEAPVVWTQAQANPVKLVDTTTMQQKSSAVELTREGNSRVQLDGWSNDRVPRRTSPNLPARGLAGRRRVRVPRPERGERHRPHHRSGLRLREKAHPSCVRCRRA